MEQLYEFLGHDFDVMLVRVLLATLLCGLIGFEREIKNHSAGFRTHILVGVGSCLMMLLSIYGFEEYITKFDTIRFDPARIPSYVISGIGFLGAGTIMVHGMTIRGLTTAASIWTVAGIGLVIGAGMYSLAILVTVVVLLSLIFLNSWERIFTRGKSENVLHLIVSKDVHIAKVLNIFDEHALLINRFEIESESKDQRNVYIELEKNQEFNRNDILDEISKLENVTYVYER
ncbi:MgtC/SapB family protein [Tenuibacillus multivorans]|uniref:Putative Mg2+ transporter-C (MgtC) family protein n=1 Tax=Tenuibacillus multivorans TaxID=237069 RepID=A0A1H0F2J5_9BACI|nr:MgtC/SapB family protein [Tenuibacillus multivorans]GEL78099.1 methyltransferase [Tenuibacillus multivorans]SDN88825.1 putative Mg2+ transporter-C (MgtC) family protein [Tenuibacillus multivorans]